MKHFLQFRDFEREEFEHLFRRTRLIKEEEAKLLVSILAPIVKTFLAEAPAAAAA